jgi:hypothetical protein
LTVPVVRIPTPDDVLTAEVSVFPYAPTVRIWRAIAPRYTHEI